MLRNGENILSPWQLQLTCFLESGEAWHQKGHLNTSPMNNMPHFSFENHWFITHVVTIRLKTFMNVFALTHTIALGTIYYKIIILYSNDMFKLQCLSNKIILFTRAFNFWEILGSHYEHIHFPILASPFLIFSSIWLF